MSTNNKPTILVTAADLAPQALALLTDYDIVFAGKTPTEDDVVALCKQHDPVAIIVRYSKVGAKAMDAAPSLKVISKHGSGTDTIDKVAAKERGVQVVAATGANAAAVAEQALALLLACAKSVVTLNERHMVPLSLKVKLVKGFAPAKDPAKDAAKDPAKDPPKSPSK